MPLFLHHPSGKHIEATGQRAHRYRRSHRFTELDPDTDTDNHYHSPTHTPDSPPDTPDQGTKGHESHEEAPHAPASPFDDLPLADISNLTVSQVLQAVDNDPDRARQALDAETQGRNRVTLTSKLRRIT